MFADIHSTQRYDKNIFTGEVGWVAILIEQYTEKFSNKTLKRWYRNEACQVCYKGTAYDILEQCFTR